MAPSTPSPLLSLPREIRDQIVEYALTSSTHTLVHNPSSKHTKPIFEEVPGHEFNQLKYVNRQLYAETAGLEIKYNALHFELPEDDAYTIARIQSGIWNDFDPALIDILPNPMTSTHFPHFLFECSQERLKWLKEAVITIRRPARPHALDLPILDKLLGLEKFKRGNPMVEVKYEYVDEVYDYREPKYQLFVPWLSVALCLGVALPMSDAWKPVVDMLETLAGVYGKGV